ncbi:hypothetical protein PENTCL1PPCAC_2998, partial [Pristionchus entomophagus]
ILLLFLLEVVRSDRVTREEVGQSAVASIAGASGATASTTTTLEKTSTGDATFFIPPSSSGSQQGMFSFDANNPLTVSTRSIDPSGGMYGPSFGGSPFGGFSGFGGASPFGPAGSPFMGGFGGSPMYGGGGSPFMMGGGGMYSPFGGADSSMNPMAIYQQMMYYKQMAQFLLGQRSGGGSPTYSPSATPYSPSPFPYARYILRDKLKTTRKD